MNLMVADTTTTRFFINNVTNYGTLCTEVLFDPCCTLSNILCFHLISSFSGYTNIQLNS